MSHLNSDVHYATYFDSHYVTRGVAMLLSLQQHAGEVSVSVLCLDEETLFLLRSLNLTGVRLIALADLELADPQLTASKENRSKIEYYFTITSAYLYWLLSSDSSINTLCYVDADHLFFSDPGPMFEELGDCQIGIIDHRFPPHHKENYDHGRYNVGILAFKSNRTSLECLSRWRDQCIEWCYNRREDGKYADQAYLNEWPEMYNGVRVLWHPGVGLGPWNAEAYKFSKTRDGVRSNKQPLIAYHFSAFRVINNYLYDTGTRWFGYRPRGVLRYDVYGTYARALIAAERTVRTTAGVAQRDSVRPPHVRYNRFAGHHLLEKIQVASAAIYRGSALLVAGRVILSLTVGNVYD
jgi:hypothetical protein